MDKIDEILRKYPYISEEIQKEQAKLNKFIVLQQEARYTLKGQALTGMPHTYGISDQTYDAVEKIIDRYQEEIDLQIKKINELLDLKKWMNKAYSELTGDERRILYLYYDDRLSFRRIGAIYKCGRYQAQKYVDEAKEKIRRIIL